MFCIKQSDTLTCAACGKVRGSNKVITVHPEGNFPVCHKFNGNQSSSFGAISPKARDVILMVTLAEKSGPKSLILNATGTTNSVNKKLKVI